MEELLIELIRKVDAMQKDVNALKKAATLIVENQGIMQGNIKKDLQFLLNAIKEIQA